KLAEYDIPGRVSHRIYERYQRALQAASAVDFGDLIVRVIELFRKHAEAAQRYSSRFRHILVDEFQDTNPAQYQLLRLLAQEHGNLCVVGDDDQSIYRWRGAEVDNILDFPRHFPGTKTIKLEQNYRSTGRILSAAHAVIEKNPRRAEKKLWTAAGEGEKLRVVLADDERDEAQRIGRLRDAAGRAGLSLWEPIESMERDPELAASARTKLLPFRELLRRMGEGVRKAPGAAEAIELVMRETGYEDRMRLEGEEGEDRLENLYELIGAAREFDAVWGAAATARFDADNEVRQRDTTATQTAT